jgi:CRP-like cAMP-binding protein
MSAPIELLRQVPLFQNVPDKLLQSIAREMTERRFSAGQELTVEGRQGVGFFVLESGSATVTVEGQDRRDLSAGEWFGEIALVDGGLRTATITANSDGVAYGLTQWQFRPLVESSAEIAWPLLEAMARRTRELEQR